jgi:N-hydroxyarylamine O-acetyltransferase
VAGAIDVDAYFRRIGYSGGRAPNFETLSGIVMAHTGSIPFENIDVLLGRPIKLDIESLQTKIVQNNRGGYCFEHVTLFAAVLEELGFQVVRHTARATLAAPRTKAPRTHMFITVLLPEGTLVLDPGFGGFAPRFPVPLTDSESNVDDTDSHVMVRDGSYWSLRTRDSGGKLIDAWASTLEPDNLVDFIVGNHYTSTHPDSVFVNWLMLRAFDGQTAISAINRDVKLRTGSDVQAYQLKDRSELRQLLAERFKMDLPEVEHLRIPSVPEWS